MGDSLQLNATDSLLICHECDLLQTLPGADEHALLTCSRCGASLHGKEPTNLELPLALLWTVVILFTIANLFPIISIETTGMHRSASIIGAVRTLWDEDMKLVSALVFTTTVLAPGLEIAALTTILSCIHFKKQPQGLRLLMHITTRSRPWSMVEVFVLGVLVSVVKLSHLAHISAGIALWSYGALILLFAAATANLEPRLLWARLNPDAE